MKNYFKNNWQLFVWPIYLIYYFIRAATGDLYDTDVHGLIQMQIILNAGLAFTYFIAYLRLKESTYKTKFLIPMLLMVGIGVTLGSLFDGSYLNVPNVIMEKPDPLFYAVFGYTELIVVPAFIVYFIFQYVLSLSNPFTEKVKELSDKVDQGNYSSVDMNNRLLEDTTIGPVLVFTSNMVNRVGKYIGEIKDSSSYVISISDALASNSEVANEASRQVSSTSQSMSQAASQQAEMISISVEEITRVGDVVNSITEQIQQNSGVINQIALQTNILALNAGIEASRAGDYGRGFAVVAENVRRLSDESKIAAEEIMEVAGSISVTLTKAFEGIRSQIEEVAALSEETAASAEEVAASSEESTSAMQEVAKLAEDLKVKSIELGSIVKSA